MQANQLIKKMTAPFLNYTDSSAKSVMSFVTKKTAARDQFARDQESTTEPSLQSAVALQEEGS